jgi:hypothetical protein
MAITIENNEDHNVIFCDDNTLRRDAVEQAVALAQEYDDKHVVFEFLHAESINGIDALKRCYKQFKKAGKSCVVIVRESLLDEFEDEFPVVPTYQEALDFIEMENIERELGF